ncbi:DNA-processing protein DprA [Nocardia puris]|uniref:DNA-processing protein DprA n=1 Tax=Nocardia puris TaxID=208602 RepID=UPI00389A9E66
MWPPGSTGSTPRATRLCSNRSPSRGCCCRSTRPVSPPPPQQFLARNRIVTAIARAVLVVEAAAKSGTMSAAEWAMQLGRPVFAVPGPITSRLSDGPHTLIRTLRARIVTDPAQITVSLDTSPF